MDGFDLSKLQQLFTSINGQQIPMQQYSKNNGGGFESYGDNLGLNGETVSLQGDGDTPEWLQNGGVRGLLWAISRGLPFGNQPLNNPNTFWQNFNNGGTKI